MEAFICAFVVPAKRLCVFVAECSEGERNKTHDPEDHGHVTGDKPNVLATDGESLKDRALAKEWATEEPNFTFIRIRENDLTILLGYF
jgi:hypothetical protein